MYNRVILMGRIANDLELKTTPSGASVVSFRVAVDRRFQTKGEEKKTDFINVVAWRNTADFIAQYFSKGRMILVEGELQTRQYQDKNGNTVYITEVIADRASFTGEKKDDASAAGRVPPTLVDYSSSATAQMSAPNVTVDADDGDCPF